MSQSDSVLAAINERVSLRPYDPRWPRLFQVERRRLMARFPGAFIDVLHIGSTAVPGLQAKPVIDILAGVDSMVAADRMVEGICAAGYNTSAEFSATLTDRRWFMRCANGSRTHHLHVVVHGDLFWREHVQFRDILRSNSVVAARYSQLKSDLASRHAEDRDAYTDAKTEFVRRTLNDGPNQA